MENKRCKWSSTNRSRKMNQPEEHRTEETKTREIFEEGDITQEEVDEAIGKMRLNKSAGRDEIGPEMIK
ncbi:hypothetical protein ILUMI_13090 [Ignelater luminosus]|uniref:Uncharacterized protein n=1 Tax=Ignelater luminosus TaxID=2038154 RepID=A0A8K0GBR4_IGNLU|nr:hypothetical protein ILUMI_13090 [Ignelater luminosus]